MFQLVIYLFLMAFTGYMAVIYPEAPVITSFAIELLLFIPALAYSFYLSRRIKIKIEIPVPVTEKGQPIDVDIFVDNQAKLPMFRGKLFVKVKNYYHKNTIIERIPLQADKNGRTSCRCELRSENCGKIKVSIGKFQTADLLGIFYFPIKRREYQEFLAVMPKIEPMVLDVNLGNRDYYSDTEEYEPDRGGEDPSEVFQIRDYRAGDHMHSIHWKMTARSEELMVKEFSKPIYCTTVLFLDMKTMKKAQDFVNADEYLERAVSVAYTLIEAHCCHMVVWYDHKRNQLDRMKVDKEEHLYELIERLFLVMPYKENVDLEELYHQEYPYHMYGLSYLLNLHLELWEGGAFSCKNEKKLL